MTIDHKVMRFYSDDHFLRAAAVYSTSVVQEMVRVQGMGPLAAVATGRAVTGAILMASVMRDGQMIGLHFKGDGTLGSVYAEASYEGVARGWCDNREAETVLKDGILDVSAGIGRGLLHVIRSQPFEKSPHISSVEIASGEVGDDIAQYLERSHQTPSIIALSVVLDSQSLIQVAGGLIIEVMPGAPEALIQRLEENVKSAKSMSQLLKDEVSLEQLVKNFLGDVGLKSVEHEHDVRYVCKCSMERVERSLFLVGKENLQRLVDEGEDLEVSCEFCKRTFLVKLSRVQKILDEFASNAN